ncbi:MAG: hypothetical protein WA655_04190 [Candidatus Korobacteraceae bacterium]
MSKADEDRARQRFADNMRETSARVKADAAASEARKKRVKKKTSGKGKESQNQ